MAKPIPTYTIKAELKDFRSPAIWLRFKIKKNLPITAIIPLRVTLEIIRVPLRGIVRLELGGVF